MSEKYSPLNSNIWKTTNNTDQEKYQYKPIIQYSPSICLHISHIEAVGGVFIEDIETIEEGLLWLTHSYKFFFTDLAAPPPEYYKTVDNFPWDGIGGNYSLSNKTLDLVDLGQQKLLSYRNDKLLQFHNIGNCDDIFNYYNVTDYNPGEGTHSSKSFIQTGYVDPQLTERVFIYKIAQGGPNGRTRTAIRNLNTILLLQNSIYTPTLISFCKNDLRFGIKFIEGAGDLKFGCVNKTCAERALACIEQVESVQELHKIGLTQCDWKHSQWLFDKAQDRLIFVDLDDVHLIPDDCGQAAVHRHSPVQNFHPILSDSKGWSEEYITEVFRSQFLRDMERGGYVSMDIRNDIYRFGVQKFLHDILDYHTVCHDHFTLLQDLISGINNVYPPSLDMIKNQLKKVL